MPTVNELRDELDDITTLKLISSAFTEASAARVQKIKKDFETNQEFYAEISRVYHLVQASAKRDADAAKKAKHTTGGDEGKKLAVAVTSNQRFYGNINVNVMQEYLKDMGPSTYDLMVLGATGRDFMKAMHVTRTWNHTVFLHDNPSKEETDKFIDNIKPYSTVMMYYPQFVSLVTQKVGKLDITQTATTDTIPDEDLNILFEPALSNTLEFFRRYVRSLLFYRVMLEADLSRTAARLITMSGAEERSTDMIKMTKSKLRKLQTSITNAKLLETFAAISGWKK